MLKKSDCFSSVITDLDISDSYIGKVALCKLGYMLPKSMNSINLSRNLINNDNISELIKIVELRRIKHLDISKNKALSSEGIKILSNYLSKSFSLESLNLSQIKLGPNGFRYLADGLINNNSLLSLDLSCTFLEDGIGSMPEALSKLKTLTYLDIQKNLFDKGENLIIILKNLVKCSSIIGINLNRINCVKLYLKETVEILLCKSDINRIHIGNNDLNKEELDFKEDSLIKLIKDSPLLTEIGLESNSFTGEEKLFEVLLNSKIRVLYLNQNPFTDKGVMKLSSLLRDNLFLSILDMSNIYLSCNEINTLINSIRYNKCIKKLFLKNVGIGNESISTLCRVITENTRIEFIDISDNNFDFAGIMVINQNMKFNKTIRQINVSSKSFSENYNNKVLIDKRIKF
jgi:Ran GTPase-activating protein (RanGAP) involved in mRNA processing and transport